MTKVRRGSRTYEYAQLVEGFRRADGTPTNRVVANLGSLDEVTVTNLRAALAASREGRPLVLSDETLPQVKAQVQASLRYLDLAVLLRVWSELGIDKLLDTALPRGDEAIPASQIVTALVLQRCVAPSSKLAAERWYPTTSLPELQAIAPRTFNNSRVHRALTALHAGEDALQEALPTHLGAVEGGFDALFVDATDTWFVGEGPALAKKGLDKEGVYRRRIGLVLLCDQRGYPLRWHTLDGRYHDPTALEAMATEAAGLPWAKGVPLSMDRAVGNAGATQSLNDRGILYVTALPDAELMSSGVPIPWSTLDALHAETTAEAVRTRLLAAGFADEAGGRLVLDLGTFDKARSRRASQRSIASAALSMLAEIEAGPTIAAVAARTGTTPQHVGRHLCLKSLTPEVRARIVDDDIDCLALVDLAKIAAAASDEQVALLGALLSEPGRHRHTSRKKSAATTYPARAVISFNPERFLDDRRKDEERVADVEALVQDVNRRLGHRSNRRTDGSAIAEVTIRLRKHGLGSVFTVAIEGKSTGRTLALRKNDAAWTQRRRGDGINVIVAHAGVPGTGVDLVRRYFAKDAIEKDFQTIKSMIELRPVHHRTDRKVRAHVTVCVLALLLLRALGERLDQSAMSALEALEPARLNRVQQGGASFYTVTRPGEGATAVLKALGLASLVDDAAVGERITAR